MQIEIFLQQHDHYLRMRNRVEKEGKMPYTAGGWNMKKALSTGLLGSSVIT